MKIAGRDDAMPSPPYPLPVRLALALCAALLRSYPQRFRARHGRWMLQNAEDLLRREHRHGGLPGLAALTARLFSDLLLGAAAERLRPNRIPTSEPPRMLDALLQDLRFARRSMAARPVLSALAALTLALGIGASASMFSVLDRVMLRPLPYPDPERIVSIYTSIPEWRDNAYLGSFWDRAKWSHAEFAQWRERESAFAAAALVESTLATLTGRGEAARVAVGLASRELFSMLGAVPVRGRLLTAQDDELRAKVALVTYGFWQELMGGRDAAVGETVVLDDVPFTVVGVLADGFRIDGFPGRVWLPIFEDRPHGYFTGNTGELDHALRVIGRLAPGISPELAAEETGRLLASIGGEDHFTAHGANVVPRLLDETRRVRFPLLLLMAAVTLLLLVACANVATFLLGQAVDRRQEIAVRGALGAGGRRIARQLMTESLLLAGGGGALGLALAALGVRALTALAPANLPRLDLVELDLRAVAFAVLVSALCGLLFGLAPAVSLARTDPARSLGALRHGSLERSRLQSSMVVAEVALATVLLVGSGLLVRSFLRLNGVDPGFEPDRVLAVRTSPGAKDFVDSSGQYQGAARRAYDRAIMERLDAVPGVAAVTLAQTVPFSGGAANNNVTGEGYEGQHGWDTIADRRFVEPGYHEVMGIPLVSGRYLNADDARSDSGSVVVVSESLARTFFPDSEAVGRKLTWWGQDSLIVGVVGDVLDRDLAAGPELTFYTTLATFDQSGGTYLLRVEGDPDDLVHPVLEVLASVDPDVPVARIEPLSAMIAGSLAEARYRTRMVGVFAALAALLSVLGLYGVTARAVAGRTREIGIRVALGAEGGRVVGLVLRDGVALATAGAALGLGLSLAGTRVLSRLLYGVEPNDPATLAAIVLLVGGMAVVATLLPSLRASRIDPVTALRSD